MNWRRSLHDDWRAAAKAARSTLDFGAENRF
jgi:hypothetical protein